MSARLTMPSSLKAMPLGDRPEPTQRSLKPGVGQERWELEGENRDARVRQPARGAPARVEPLPPSHSPDVWARRTSASSSATLSGWYSRRTRHSRVPDQFTRCASVAGGVEEGRVTVR